MTIPQPISPKFRDSSVARKFVSQNGRGYIAVAVMDANGDPVAPQNLTLEIFFDDLSGTSVDPRGTSIINVDTTTGIITDAVGFYHYDLGPEWTQRIGLINAEWTYDVGDSTGVKFMDNMQVLEQMPYYDTLKPEAKRMVEQVSWFFGDLFDSTAGGPFLQENFQSHFSYERIAQLSSQAVMKFNMLGYPVTSYGVDVDAQKLPTNMEQVVVWGTKLECIRHLALSYTEQPAYPNEQTTYTDRRDYNERWYRVLEEETPVYEKAIKMAKRSLLNLGRGSLLVSGGIYGGGMKGGLYVPGLYAAQTRAFRFYPASFAVGVGNFLAGSGY